MKEEEDDGDSVRRGNRVLVGSFDLCNILVKFEKGLHHVVNERVDEDDNNPLSNGDVSEALAVAIRAKGVVEAMEDETDNGDGEVACVAETGHDVGQSPELGRQTGNKDDEVAKGTAGVVLIRTLSGMNHHRVRLEGVTDVSRWVKMRQGKKRVKTKLLGRVSISLSVLCASPKEEFPDEDDKLYAIKGYRNVGISLASSSNFPSLLPPSLPPFPYLPFPSLFPPSSSSLLPFFLVLPHHFHQTKNFFFRKKFPL